MYIDHGLHVSDGAGGRCLLLHTLLNKGLHTAEHTHPWAHVHLHACVHIYNTQSHTRDVVVCICINENSRVLYSNRRAFIKSSKLGNYLCLSGLHLSEFKIILCLFKFIRLGFSKK